MKDGMRLPLDNGRTTWAVRHETLAEITRAMSGDLGSAEIHAEIARLAADAGETSQVGGVAVIPLRGLLTPRPSLLSVLFGGGGGLMGFRASLRSALAAEEVKSIVIDVDSPGGSTALIAETAAEVRAARRQKPIVAVANTMAASGAYYIASQANELVVTPSGLVGSIGVYVLHADFSKLNERVGVAVTYISAGRFKTEGNEDEPLSDEAREHAQEVVNDLYSMFVNDVAKGRGTTPAQVRNGYGEGRIVTARRAVELGMADRIETLERAVARQAAGGKEPGQRSELLGAHEELEAEASASQRDPEQNDNERPNAEAEEGARRISQLLADHPIHVP
jgi:signal peptide peptidase SppA